MGFNTSEEFPWSPPRVSFHRRFSRDQLSLIFNESRRRPSASKIKSRIPAKNGRPSVSPGLIKLGRFRGGNVVFAAVKTIGRSCFSAAVRKRRVYYRCIEARRKRARKRGCWHNSGIFLEILRGHRYFHVLSIPFAVFSGRTNRSNVLLRNGSLGITHCNEQR